MAAHGHVKPTGRRQNTMFKPLATLSAALLAVATLASCGPQPVNANCAALGMLGGAVLGEATNNNLAQSALAGGVAGAVAGSQGMCN
jgi:hypothetical protein